MPNIGQRSFIHTLDQLFYLDHQSNVCYIGTMATSGTPPDRISTHTSVDSGRRD